MLCISDIQLEYILSDLCKNSPVMTDIVGLHIIFLGFANCDQGWIPLKGTTGIIS